jgi:hypothetical protein
MSHLGMGGSRTPDQGFDTLHVMRQSLMTASDQVFESLDGENQCWS